MNFLILNFCEAGHQNKQVNNDTNSHFPKLTFGVNAIR